MTDIVQATLRRPLPTFDQWLEENGDGTRGDGFEAFVELIQRTRDRGALPHYDDDAKALLRLYTGICIAVVEACNVEHQHGRTPDQIIQLMPRALAMAAMNATASVMVEDTPWRQIATILVEDFRFAAKQVADDLSKATHGG